ncbi:MAG: PAS domain S-box protein [Candidatus Cloacimonetes bacterium]|nr:PAS domain S-box protein [Candidatus Cloacimonadota bacterium]MCF7814385.1 PAS domain S-box protein [Candidatus Cloacimonadota bacterium]MCF7868535.1 PAS domain S-box protein [Candidatus Cloacimonadota bacterium]MCF7884045.1 PAS domain S-box protein [Candidatus Cloacimonadota bacterium]
MNDKKMKDLRKKAEEKYKKQKSKQKLNNIEKDKLIHELQVHQIELEMQNEELLLIQQELEISRDRYSHLYNKAPIGYAVLDEKARIVNVNHKFADLLDLDLAQIIDKNFIKFVHTDHKEVFWGRYKAFFKNPDKKLIVISLISKKKQILVEVKGSKSKRTLFSNDSNEDVLLVSINDITKLEKTRLDLLESEETFRATLESIADPVFITDDDGNITFVCDNIEHNLGYTVQEIQQMLNIKKLIGEMPFTLFELNEKKHLDNFEITIKSKSGKPHVFLMNVKRVNIKKGTILFTLREITEKQIAEQKLKESEKRFRDIAENAAEWIWEVDKEGKYTFVSSNVQEILGFTSAEMLQKHFYDIADPEIREEVKKRALEINFQNKKPFRKTISACIKKDGTKVWLLSSGVPILDDKGKLLGFRGGDLDITERINTEKALKESEERYRTLLENVKAGIGYYDLEGNVILFNKTAAEFMGGKPEDFTGKTLIELYGEETGKFYLDRIKSAVKADDFEEYEDKVELPSGTMWFNSKYNKIFDSNGKIIGVQIISQDITELKQNQEKLQKLFDNMNSAFAYHEIETDKNGKPIDYRFVEVNKTFESMTNHKAEDIVGKLVTKVLPGTEKDPADWIGVYGKVAQTGKPKNFEKYSEALKKWFKISAYSPQKGFFATVFDDITESKLLQIEVEESEERYRGMFENSTEFLFTLDLKGNFTDVNKAAEKKTGYSKAELLKKNFKDYIPRKDHKKLFLVFNKLYRTGKPIHDLFIEAKMRNDEIRYFLISLSLLRSGDKIIGFQGTSTDITERRKATEKLRESEERFRAMFESSKDANMTLEPPDWKFTSGNQALVDLFKLKNLEELMKLAPWQISPPKQPDGQSSIEKAKKMIDIAVKEGVNYFEWIHRKRDGRDFFATVLLNKVNLKDKNILLATVRDITKEKLATQALQESEEKYRVLFEKSTDPSLIIEDNEFIDCNDTTVKFLKFKSKKDIIGKNPWQLSPLFQPDGEKSETKAKRLIAEAHKKGYARFEWVHLNSDRNRVWVDIALTFLKEKEKDIIYTVWRDITEKKKAQHELEKYQSDLALMVKEATMELEQKNALLSEQNAELEKFNRIFVNREFRIKQLRDKIKNLEEKIFGTIKPDDDEGKDHE